MRTSKNPESARNDHMDYLRKMLINKFQKKLPDDPVALRIIEGEV